MANQNRTMSVSYRWTEDAKELRQVTHKSPFSGLPALPNCGRSFTSAHSSRKDKRQPGSAVRGLHSSDEDQTETGTDRDHRECATESNFAETVALAA